MSLGGQHFEYKRCTDAFLRILLSESTNSTSTQRNSNGKYSLATFDRCVKDIATQLSSGTNLTLGHKISVSLGLCRRAIDLRQRVSKLYPFNPDDGHSFIISALNKWYNSLSQLATPLVTISAASVKTGTISSGINYSNAYDLLSKQNDEEDEPDNGLTNLDEEPLSFEFYCTDKINARDAARKEAEETLRFTLACLFSDYDDLIKTVCTAWEDAKNERISFIAASSATLVAMRLAEPILHDFTLKYPSLATAEAIYNNGICDWLPKNAIPNSQRISEGNISKPYVEGAMLFDLLQIGRMLSSFSSAIPQDKNKTLVAKPGFFGRSYDEDAHNIHDVTSFSSFILQELNQLYNFHVAARASSNNRHADKGLSVYSEFPVMAVLMTQLEKFFETKVVSLSLCFSVYCWVKSVIILQGSGSKRISRICSTAKTTLYRIQNLVRENIVIGHINMTDKKLAGFLEGYFINNVNTFLENDRIFHKNPVLASALMLDGIMTFIHLGCQAIHCVANSFRLVTHLYNALVKCELMEEGSVPFLENLYQFYEDLLFFPKRPEPGSFAKCFLTSGQFTLSTTNAILKGNADALCTRRGPFKIKRAKIAGTAVHGEDVSELYRILIKNDLTAVTRRHGDNSIDILKKVVEIATYEQCVNRILGTSLLTVCDSFPPLLRSLMTKLERIAPTMSVPDGTINGRSSSASEPQEGLVFKLLVILDTCATGVHPDGTPATAAELEKLPLMKAAIASVVPSVYTSHFSIYETEKSIYYLSPHVNMMSREYGTVNLQSLAESSVTQHEANLFGHHMSVLEEHATERTTITAAEVARLKEDVKLYPRIMYKFDLNETMASIFLYIVASPVIKNTDRCILAEWFIAMGANDIFNVVDNRHSIKPIHLCAQNNRLAILKMLLSYSEYRDINFVTSGGKTCLSLASAAGHYDVICFLIENGASMRRPCQTTLLTKCANLSPAERESKTRELLQTVATFDMMNGNPMRPGDALGTRDSLFAQQLNQRQAETRRVLAREHGLSANPTPGPPPPSGNGVVSGGTSISVNASPQPSPQTTSSSSSSKSNNKKKGKK